MTRRIGYVNTRQAWNRYTFTLLVRDVTSLFQKWHVKSNILGAVFSGNRLLRRNQRNLRFSYIINPLESFERPAFFHDSSELRNYAAVLVLRAIVGMRCQIVAIPAFFMISPPQALPEAMPQGIKKFAYSLRLRLRHFIAQYLPSGRVYANFLSPGGNMQIFYALRLRLGLCLRQFFKNFRFFRNLAPGVARGYAPGHKKICIFPQATP
ncbi:hypothetical protein T08_14288, partial [Trichinella sp. T8]